MRSLSKVIMISFGVGSLMALSACFGQPDLSESTTDQGGLDSALVRVENTTSLIRHDEVVVISSSQLAGFTRSEISRLQVLDGGNEIPSQLSDLNDDGEIDELLFSASFEPGQVRAFSVTPVAAGYQQTNFVKRTHAELSKRIGGSVVDGKYSGGSFESVVRERLPSSHVPGDGLYRYEGPGWESDKVAYRLYFDHRNVNDIFGKSTSDMVLAGVGHDGYSYHKPAEWGLDILKVGDSLGLGGVGMRVKNNVHRVSTAKDMEVAIVEDNILRSQIEVSHKSWELNAQSYDISSRLSILAGSRLTHNQLTISGSPDNLVTGLVKHQPSELLTSELTGGEWGYIATYGEQSYVEDNLGMAILFKKNNLIELGEDSNNHLVVMKPIEGLLDYYFLAAWVQEAGGIQTKVQFRAYLDNLIKKLNSPVDVKVSMSARG